MDDKTRCHHSNLKWSKREGSVTRLIELHLVDKPWNVNWLMILNSLNKASQLKIEKKSCSHMTCSFRA